MYKDIIVNYGREFERYTDAIMVENDINAYRIIYKTPRDLTGCIIKATCKRSDGTIISDLGTVENGNAVYVIASNVYKIPGEFSVRITVVSADGSVLTVCEVVANAIEALDGGEPGEDEKGLIDKILIAQAQLLADFNDHKNNADENILHVTKAEKEKWNEKSSPSDLEEHKNAEVIDHPNGSVTEGKIADGAVTRTKISDSAINSSKIVDKAVLSSKLADGAVINDKLANLSVSEEKIQNSAITEPKIADNSVTTNKIVDGAIVEIKIENEAVTEAKIADNAITTSKIDDKAVTNDKISDFTISGEKIQDYAITRENMADYAITTDKIDDEAITEVKIADGNVTNHKLSVELQAEIDEKANKQEVYDKKTSDNRYLPKNEVNGVPAQLNMSIKADALNYRIFGNSIQNGTPTPDNPTEVQSVGDLVADGEYAGKYKIEIVITNEICDSSILIYLDEPLRKIGDYADYIDFENQKVVRNIKPLVINGNEKMSLYTSSSLEFFYISFASLTNFIRTTFLCTHYKYNPNIYNASEQSPTNIYQTASTCIQPSWIKYGETTIEQQKKYFKDQYNNGNPVIIYYVLKTPTVEDITLAPMPLDDGTNNITTNTAVLPSNIYVKYYQNPSDVINELRKNWGDVEMSRIEEQLDNIIALNNQLVKQQEKANLQSTTNNVVNNDSNSEKE